MAKWKTQESQKKQFSVEYLKFEKDKQKSLKVSDWDFSKAPAGYLFKCFVTAEDGQPVDKVWIVWDFESTQKLKKKLGVKNTLGQKELIATMRMDDEDEMFFDIE